jgi:hypothetical protein
MKCWAPKMVKWNPIESKHAINILPRIKMWQFVATQMQEEFRPILYNRLG